MKHAWRGLAAIAMAAVCAVASAHSASDAYLTLTTAAPANGAPGRTQLRGQWDVALRDLDFVLTLDENGDGNITWAELRRHQAEIARYALAQLHFTADGKACDTRLQKQMVDNHADGAYAALFFNVDCAARAKRVSLDYRLFFAIDPSHRAITVVHNGTDTAAAVLSPENAKIELDLVKGSSAAPKP